MIYLDNNATTRVADEVLQSMQACLGDGYANPSSLHSAGRRVRDAIEQARSSVAGFLGAAAAEIVFTGCGTEGNNLALRGRMAASPGLRLVLSTVEHPSVLEVGRYQESHGGDVTWVGVDREGRLDLDQLDAGLSQGPALVSVMWANNETGIIFPISEIAARVHAAGSILHCDAVQAAARIRIDVRACEVDLLAISGHKMHGPKGVGALYVRHGIELEPLLLGGGQESGRRGGTENTASIVGLGCAARLVGQDLEKVQARVCERRDRMETELAQAIHGLRITGGNKTRLPNTSHICLDGSEAESIVLRLSDENIAISSGSACASGSMDVSHVLRAMNMPTRRARGSLRISLSRYTTDEDVDALVRILPTVI